MNLKAKRERVPSKKIGFLFHFNVIVPINGRRLENLGVIFDSRRKTLKREKGRSVLTIEFFRSTPKEVY